MQNFPRSGVVVLMLSMALTACIRIDVTQTVSKTGVAQVELLYDLSKFTEMSDEMEENDDGALTIGIYGPASSSSSSAGADAIDCAAFRARQAEESAPIPLSGIHCADKAPNVFLLTGSQKLRRSEFIRRRSGKKTVYLYKIQNANALMNSQTKEIESDPSIDAGSDQMGKELMSSILDGTFTVIMPGRITKAPGGVIAGNRVTFKLTDFPLKRGGFVQSEE